MLMPKRARTQHPRLKTRETDRDRDGYAQELLALCYQCRMENQLVCSEILVPRLDAFLSSPHNTRGSAGDKSSA